MLNDYPIVTLEEYKEALAKYTDLVGLAMSEDAESEVYKDIKILAKRIKQYEDEWFVE